MATMTFKTTQIRGLREGLGLTQEEFAKRIGMTKQAVSSWESGQIKPSVDTLAKIASEFGAKIESFFSMEGK